MSKSLAAAVVGCGVQGRLHVEHLRQIDGVEVVALCDLDPERAAELAREHGIAAAYQDHRDLLERETVDVLTVCTMPSTHRVIVADALEAGAHVFCEKPLSTDSVDALEMVRAAQASDRMLAVGFNMRFTTAAEAVRRFIAEGELGAPVCARGSVLADNVPWWGRHYVKGDSGGGVLNSTAIHVLDLMMSVAGEWAPTTASASATRLFPKKRGQSAPSAAAAAAYDVEDLVFGHVRFASGFWLAIQGAWVWDEPGFNCRVDFVGDHGQAQLDPLQFSGERHGSIERLWPDVTGEIESNASLTAELDEFVEAVRGGATPSATGEQALVVQCVVDALYKSAELGREVDVVVPEEARFGFHS